VGEGYPAAPPTLYVVPTPSMVVKPRHALVDPSGLVATPYLASWSAR
jgi:ESCRT-I complex subunit TSG101